MGRGGVHASDLQILSAMLNEGKVVPVVTRRFNLNEVPEAMRYLGEGHVGGKIVITMQDEVEADYDRFEGIVTDDANIEKRWTACS